MQNAEPNARLFLNRHQILRQVCQVLVGQAHRVWVRHRALGLFLARTDVFGRNHVFLSGEVLEFFNNLM